MPIIGWFVQIVIESILAWQSVGFLAFKQSEPVFAFKDKTESHLEQIATGNAGAFIDSDSPQMFKDLDLFENRIK